MTGARFAEWLRTRPPRQRLGLAFAAGLVSALGLEPYALWPLTIAAVAVWALLIPAAPRARSALAIGWWFGFGHMLFGLRWIALAFSFQSAMPAWLGWVAVVLLSMVMAIYAAAAAGLAWRLGWTPLSRALALTGGWMLTEWIRGYLFGGFPWNPLGVVWLAVPSFAQAAAVVGGLGLSGLAVLAGCAMALSADGHRQAGNWLIATFALIWAGGQTYRWAAEPRDTTTRIEIVQANIGQSEKWDESKLYAHTRRYVTLSTVALARGPTLLLWPEAAVPYLLEEEPAPLAMISRQLGADDVLITGGLAANRNSSGEAISAHNSMFVVAPGSRLLGRYDKSELVPFGEYLPLRWLLEPLGISRLAPGGIDFLPGPGPRTLRLPGFPPVGPLICYEVIFSGHVVDHNDRPEWLLNASNDAWFSDAGAWMHLAQARLRAIEEGLPVARATPTGVSAVIDAHGVVRKKLGRDVAGVLTATLPGALPPTPFAQGGEAIPLGLALILLASAGFGYRRRT